MAQYSTIADISVFAVSQVALQGSPPADQNQALQAASDLIDSYLRAQFKLPIQTPYSQDIRRCCAILAAYDLMAARGLNPEFAGDKSIQDRADQQISWLKDVAAGRAFPNVIDSSPSPVDGVPSGGPRVTSDRSRGYQDLDNDGHRHHVAFRGRRQ